MLSNPKFSNLLIRFYSLNVYPIYSIEKQHDARLDYEIIEKYIIKS